jgi:anti-sigma factor RsiW
MNHEAEDRLMRYVDGDLDEEQALAVEEWLAQSSEARAFLRDLSLIGREVRSIAEEYGKRSGPITDDVMSRIMQEGGLRGGPARAAAPRERRIHTVLPAVGLAFAAAAAVAIYLKPHHTIPVESVRNDPSATTAPEPFSATSVSSMVAQAEDPEGGPSIESVDFGAQNGTIFMVPSGPELTPVLWMDDDDDPSSG